MTEFLHGVQVVNIDTGARSIAIASSSVIGIVGTAPLADTDAFPINTPVLVTSPSQAAKLSATTGTDAGTLPGALDAIFDQSSAVVVVIRVEKGANESATLANVLGGVNAQTGAYEGVHALLAAKSIVGVKPRILVAPGFTHVHPADPAKPEAVLFLDWTFEPIYTSQDALALCAVLAACQHTPPQPTSLPTSPPDASTRCGTASCTPTPSPP